MPSSKTPLATTTRVSFYHGSFTAESRTPSPVVLSPIAASPPYWPPKLVSGPAEPGSFPEDRSSYAVPILCLPQGRPSETLTAFKIQRKHHLRDGMAWMGLSHNYLFTCLFPPAHSNPVFSVLCGASQGLSASGLNEGADITDMGGGSQLCDRTRRSLPTRLPAARLCSRTEISACRLRRLPAALTMPDRRWVLNGRCQAPSAGAGF